MPNKFTSHYIFVVEDKANRLFFNGIKDRHRAGLIFSIDEGEVARGCERVKRRVKELGQTLGKYQQRKIVVLVDFDGLDRRAEVMEHVSSEHWNRVFVFGPQHEPEFSKLRGESLANQLMDSCPEYEKFLNSLDDYKHNIEELQRLLKENPELSSG